MSNGTVTSIARSMTGFARVSGVVDGTGLDVEVRAVNQRYLEINLKGPKFLNGMERDIKAIFQRLHRRGRIDIAVNRRTKASPSPAVRVNSDALDPIVAAYTEACKRYGVRGDGLAAFIGTLVLRDSTIVDESEMLSEDESALLRGLFEQASQALGETRAAEGVALVADVTVRLSALDRIRTAIGERMAGASGRLRERLLERLELIAADIKADPERMALEVALLADRVDVSEELARLEIHIQQFLKTLQGHPDGVGRKLDFLTQEIGREFNTVGSKAQDAWAQGLVVEAKAELERIREQVQNIE